MKKLMIATAAAAAAASMTVAAAPASAEHYSSYNYERAGYRDNDRYGYDNRDQGPGL